jgi:hypothetical protein
MKMKIILFLDMLKFFKNIFLEEFFFIKAGLIDDNIDDFMLVQTMLEVNM